MKNIYAIVLAGGRGTRVNAAIKPKVLYSLVGRPILRYVYDNVKKVTSKIIIVTGFRAQKIKEEMKNEGVQFVYQAKRLGTAHAALRAKKLLQNKKGVTLIVNGDSPLFSPQTYKKLISEVAHSKCILAIASAVEHEHPGYGRVLRDKQGKVIGVREIKDATEEERKILEKNVGVYAARNQWLWKALDMIKKSRVTGEYYITDLIEVAIQDGKNVKAVRVMDLDEIKGINSLEELWKVEKIIHRKRSEHMNQQRS